MSFDYHNMPHKTLSKSTVLRSENLSVTRMEYRNLHQLRRLMLYPTELRAVSLAAIALTNEMRSAPHLADSIQ